ncbi:hypothetical protein C3L33_22036, partial [Rhododendron williamsianum]
MVVDGEMVTGSAVVDFTTILLVNSATSAMLLCHQVLFYLKCQDYTSDKGSAWSKRLASEELVRYWDNKRLNVGLNVYPSSDQIAVSGGNQTGMYPPLSNPSGSSATAPNLPVNLQFPHVATTAMVQYSDEYSASRCRVAVDP